MENQDDHKVEFTKAAITIGGKEYELRLTMGFWRMMQEKHEVTRENMEAKLKSDFGKIGAAVIYYGIWFGLRDTKISAETMPVKIEDIEGELEVSAMDAVEQAIINGMTKAEKKMVEIFRKKRQQEVDKLDTEDLNSKK